MHACDETQLVLKTCSNQNENSQQPVRKKIKNATLRGQNVHWILCLYVPGFQRQVFKHVKIFAEQSKESKEQKKNKGSVLVAESVYNAQNAQFGLVMKETKEN